MTRPGEPLVRPNNPFAPRSGLFVRGPLGADDLTDRLVDRLDGHFPLSASGRPLVVSENCWPLPLLGDQATSVLVPARRPTT